MTSHARTTREAALTRRSALALLAAACLAPAPVPGQPADRRSHVAVLSATASRTAEVVRAFEQRLRELGYVDGSTLTLDFVSAEGRLDRLPELAARLVARGPGVIAAIGGAESAFAARGATTAIPIVFTVATDPVADGLVPSVARPGANITGVSSLNAELDGKRLELLKEVMPGLKRAAVLVNPSDRTSAQALKRVETGAQVLGLRLNTFEVRTPAEIDAAMGRAKAGSEAVLLLGTPYFFSHQSRVAVLAAKHRLPTIAPWREFPAAGGLMGHGTNVREMFRRSADMVARILKGARPGDMPVEQPTTFELVFNARTAEALGITLGPALLTRADMVLR